MQRLHSQQSPSIRSNTLELKHSPLQFRFSKLSPHRTLQFRSNSLSIKQKPKFIKLNSSKNRTNRRKMKHSFPQISHQSNFYENDVNLELEFFDESKKLKQVKTGKKRALKTQNLDNFHTTLGSLNTKKYINQLKKSKIFDKNNINEQKISIQDYYQYTLKYTYRSQRGKGSSKQHKINQDTVIIYPMLNNQTYKHFFAICDGHGRSGHIVSNHIKAAFSKELKHFNFSTPQFEKNYQMIIKNYFLKIQTELQKSDIQIDYSGSTCNSIWMCNSKIYCANIGDSRAILAEVIPNRKNQSVQRKVKIIQLSRDHKLSCKDQAQRIMYKGGQIKNINGRGPLRIWAKGQKLPGLSMTRSFGDKASYRLGTIHVPEITVYNMNRRERVLIIGSDGLWQFLSNEQVVDIAIKYYQDRDLDGASNQLLNAAKSRWKINSQIIDDITFMIFFFYRD